MEGEGIHNGDYSLPRQQSKAAGNYDSKKAAPVGAAFC
jgi:hypothetical protein